MWCLDPGFKDIVSHVWQQHVSGTYMYQLVSKLKNLKKPLKEMNRNKFSDVEKAVGVASAFLKDIQIQMNAQPTLHSLIVAEKEAADSYRHLLKDLMSSSHPTKAVHLPTVRAGSLMTLQHQNILLYVVSSTEIKEALFSITTVKSPGPDVNTTTITLIPKVDNPASVLEFRPIACCNTIYKCIAKVLCNRLSRVLPDIVSESQGGFVKGRSIVDNVLICQDLVRLYSRKVASPRCLIKIDPKKVYDSVEWSFLEQMLGALNFSGKFINLMMQCVTTPTYSLSVNGRLQLNKTKSEIYFNGIRTDIVNNIMQVSGFVRCSLPFKYLGIPISSKKLSNVDGIKLIDKMVARIRGWGTRHLSYAGRLTLVSSVLTTLHSYWVTIYLIPNGILNKINAICRNFLWPGKDEYKKALAVSWDTCCTPKSEGGLGLNDAKNCNRALLGKMLQDSKANFEGEPSAWILNWCNVRNEDRVKMVVRRPGNVVAQNVAEIKTRVLRKNMNILKPRDSNWLQSI
ncbi:uncharacterized protein LOC141639024 [Silene latifolia]|uniref:uncharacterized protein LOC141639024 n=1 Tax=Silene latifolia TaxID=37657 RepID=UPI003D76EA9C